MSRYPCSISADNFHALKLPIRSISVRLAVALCMAMLCAVAEQPAIAQTPPWTTNGANINNTNTGNVGIGTTAPEAALHVAGNITSPGTGGESENSVSAHLRRELEHSLSVNTLRPASEVHLPSEIIPSQMATTPSLQVTARAPAACKALRSATRLSPMVQSPCP
jgi:hypothetical protein